MKTLLRYDIAENNGTPWLTFQTDATALSRLVKTQLGKTILFTDNDDWSDEEIILGYRAQSNIEHAFRDMKNPHFLGWTPMFHWTDTKIRVHAFYCVLALTLTSLLQRTLHQHGLDLSVAAMLELLGGIRETLVVYPRKPGQRSYPTVACLSSLTPEQESAVSILDLGRYLPE